VIGFLVSSDKGKPIKEGVKKVSDRKIVFVYGKKALVLNILARSRVFRWIIF
jgi:hypothetical protein